MSSCSSRCFQDSKTPGCPLISFTPLFYFFFSLAYFICASFRISLVSLLSATCSRTTPRTMDTSIMFYTHFSRTRTLLGRFSYACTPTHILRLYPTVIFYGLHFYREIWTLHLYIQYLISFLLLLPSTLKELSDHFGHWITLASPIYSTMPRLGRFA